MSPGKPTLLGELLAEFFGTLVLIALGDGVVAMVVLFADPQHPEAVSKGGYTNITIGWGLAVLMGLCVAGRVSGGHLNPAVTLALAVFRGFPWRKVIRSRRSPGPGIGRSWSPASVRSMRSSAPPVLKR